MTSINPKLLSFGGNRRTVYKKPGHIVRVKTPRNLLFISYLHPLLQHRVSHYHRATRNDLHPTPYNIPKPTTIATTVLPKPHIKLPAFSAPAALSCSTIVPLLLVELDPDTPVVVLFPEFDEDEEEVLELRNGNLLVSSLGQSFVASPMLISSSP